MERPRFSVEQLRDRSLLVGVVGIVSAGTLAAELAQGADPVIFSPETGKAIAMFLATIGASGISIGAGVEVLRNLTDSSNQGN